MAQDVQRSDDLVDQELEGGILKAMERYWPIRDATTRGHGGVSQCWAYRHLGKDEINVPR